MGWKNTTRIGKLQRNYSNQASCSQLHDLDCTFFVMENAKETTRKMWYSEFLMDLKLRAKHHRVGPKKIYANKLEK